MNKTTNENILAALERINDEELVGTQHRILVRDTNTEGKYCVEVELLRKKDRRPWRSISATYGLSEDAVISVAQAFRKFFVEEKKSKESRKENNND